MCGDEIMKRWSLLLMILAACTLPTFAADRGSQTSRFGAGISLGGPSGLSAKYWLDSDHAIDGALAFSSGDFLLLTGDYLVHFNNLPTSETIRPYAGAGALLCSFSTSKKLEFMGFTSTSSNTLLALRVPLGLEWTVSKAGIFLELTPHLGLVPATVGAMSGALGARYYF